MKTQAIILALAIFFSMLELNNILIVSSGKAERGKTPWVTEFATATLWGVFFYLIHL